MRKSQNSEIVVKCMIFYLNIWVFTQSWENLYIAYAYSQILNVLYPQYHNTYNINLRIYINI